MADEIKLTLNPFGEENAQAAAAAQEAPREETQKEVVEKKVQADALSMQNFSDEEKKMIDDFSKQINILDTNLVFSYGAGAQQNISQFSDSALKNVQTKDLDQVDLTDPVLDAISELREENNKLREELEILKKEIKGGNVQ